MISSCDGVSTGAGTTNFLAKWSFVTGVLEDSNIFENSVSGNIGIGTTAPSAKLAVSGGASWNDGFVVDGSTLNGTGLNVKNTAVGGHSWAIISTNTNNGITGDLMFYDATTAISPMVMTKAGNVGIGTSVPSAKLDVNGSIKTGGGAAGTSCAGNPEGAFAYDSGNRHVGLLRLSKSNSKSTNMQSN